MIETLWNDLGIGITLMGIFVVAIASSIIVIDEYKSNKR